jgi:DNA-directed RNA polymerase specialized sigma24 family protein
MEKGSFDAALAASVDEPGRFGELFDAFVPEIWRYLAFHQGKQVADELVSEVFVRAFARRATFDHRRGTARGWLYGIARSSGSPLGARPRRRRSPTGCPTEGWRGGLGFPMTSCWRLNWSADES